MTLLAVRLTNQDLMTVIVASIQWKEDSPCSSQYNHWLHKEHGKRNLETANDLDYNIHTQICNAVLVTYLQHSCSVLQHHTRMK